MYAFRNAKILIEPKADIKKRLGRLPDRADAYVNGLWALQFVEGLWSAVKMRMRMS